MKKKVIWIVNEYNGPSVESMRQISLSRYLEENGYIVYLIAGSTDFKDGDNKINNKSRYQYIEKDGAKYYVINTSGYKRSYQRALVAVQFQLRLWKLRRQLPMPDVIVSDFAGLFGNVFLKWKKEYGTRVIYDVLDLWPEGFVEMGYIKRTSLLAKILFAMEHKSYREADGIIFSMQGGRDYIVDKGWSCEVGGDVDTSNIGYLDNGIDLDIVDKQRSMFSFEDSDLDSSQFKVVYLGSISAMNGLDVLVETARQLEKRHNDKVIILVYGYGNQEEKLKKMVNEYGLKNIKFKGKLDKKFAMSLLTKSDLNIFTFRDSPLWKYGVSPNKLFMYFASGKPVLSMIKPAYDLVEEKHAGISVKNDPDIVANAIEWFSRMESEEYDKYCQNARAIAEEYDYKKLVKVLIDKIEG